MDAGSVKVRVKFINRICITVFWAKVKNGEVMVVFDLCSLV